MEKQHYKPHLGTPFSVEISTVKNEGNTWDSTKISIFRDSNLIGEYIRNYPSYAALTFYPFSIGGEWYALYSPHYTTTRVMKLHEDRIEDWCGEEPSSSGFCPVEFYVPRYKKTTHALTTDGKVHNYETYYVDKEYKDIKEFLSEELESIDPIEFKNTDFGFMCGCVWGDDTSWKIRYIDLAQIPDKILSITDKFGYWQMPTRLTLKECIGMRDWGPDHNWITMVRMEHINLKTNERC